MWAQNTGYVGSSGVVIAFEPHPRTFKRLQGHLQLNTAHNVRAMNAAAGEKSGVLELFDTPAHESGQASFVAHSTSGISAGLVAVHRLDDVVQETASRTFLKIDVEGFEYQVLKGAPHLLSQEPVVCMECTPGLNPNSDNALAAYRLIMDTELYGAYRFKNTKFRSDPTLVRADDSYWRTAKHENAIFIPERLRSELPAFLFG